jgi:hypothetical protein
MDDEEEGMNLGDEAESPRMPELFECEDIIEEEDRLLEVDCGPEKGD